MIIITGVRLAGKVDAVPRVGHVATRFFHLYYVPLIPLGTVLVVDPESETGLPLPLSMKSVLAAWLRSAAWVGLILGAFLGVTRLADNNPERALRGLALAATSAVALVPLYRLRFFRAASYERAMEIVRLAGLSPEQRLMLEVAYGRMNADQAEREWMRQYEQQVAGSV